MSLLATYINNRISQSDSIGERSGKPA